MNSMFRTEYEKILRICVFAFILKVFYFRSSFYLKKNTLAFTHIHRYIPRTRMLKSVYACV